VKRFTSDDRNEQGHELMPAERDGDAAMLEPAVEGVASERIWSRRQVVRLAGATLAGVAGLATFGSDNAEAAPIVAAGSSPKDGSGWQTYPGGGPGALFIDVNTSAAGFSRTPVYVTSLGGRTRHWELVGVSAVYQPTATGFRVHLRHLKDVPITRLDALDNSWHVNWHAILV
jgi:hypothetical protein